MNFWKTSTFVLTTALGAMIAYSTVSPAQAGPQPKMFAALTALDSAKASLEAATPDKGGFRVKALQATKEAIEMTKKGIQFDAEHESKDEKKTQTPAPR